ncbi:uncharacterized protein LOC130949127 [Arachis stenosperma]|uniref:uncharacterized protein LOC130949127 n=1 Tax=Arachis stenosperma TaxID=217475 RepID=UPI0025AB7BA6|nr:uncharacterized protein LOC130949127 [Arachis stenosperma]
MSVPLQQRRYHQCISARGTLPSVIASAESAPVTLSKIQLSLSEPSIFTSGSVTLLISSLLPRAPPLVLRPPSACSASRLWLPLVLRARRYNPQTLKPSNLWSQTSTIPASNPAPQTTSTVVIRALGNSFQSRTTALPPLRWIALVFFFSLCVLCHCQEKATGVKPSLEEVYTKCHTKKDKSWIDERSEKVIGEFKKRKTELSQVDLSLDNEGDVETSKESLDIPDDYTIWNEFMTKEKKKATFGLGSFGLDLSSKLDSGNCSETSKDNLNIEQELHMWKEKAKEQEMINEQQKVKLNDAEHKLKDQGRQLKAQQKRIGSTEKTIHALYKKLNLPLLSTMSVLADDELGTGSSDDEDDNMSD